MVTTLVQIDMLPLAYTNHTIPKWWHPRTEMPLQRLSQPWWYTYPHQQTTQKWFLRHHHPKSYSKLVSQKPQIRRWWDLLLQANPSCDHGSGPPTEAYQDQSGAEDAQPMPHDTSRPGTTSHISYPLHPTKTSIRLLRPSWDASRPSTGCTLSLSPSSFHTDQHHCPTTFRTSYCSTDMRLHQ